MLEHDLRRVQRVARQAQEPGILLRQRVLRKADEDLLVVAVDLVPDDRKARGGEVDADSGAAGP